MICLQCHNLSPSGLRCQCGELRCPKCYAEHRCPAAARPLWPHQIRGIEAARQAQRDGHRAIAITSPTGGGKTRMITEMIADAVSRDRRAALFTNRRILTRQTVDTLATQGVDYGIIAAGYDLAVLKHVQVCSIQTIASRVFAREQLQLPLAHEVYIDEAHGNKGVVAQQIIRHYRSHGATVFGFTATPVGIGQLYSSLVVAGTNSELRHCGALVPCHVFAPSEPDLRAFAAAARKESLQGVRREQRLPGPGEEIPESLQVKLIMGSTEESEWQWHVFANVFDAWKQLNPARQPTLLFAPSVATSRWFARHFDRQGVAAEHIDGETSEADRDEILERSRAGHTKVVCSCDVFREGADLPWVTHGILLKVCGTLTGYLQIVGRLLRAYPGKDKCILLDHSGCWWRHGSPNVDRHWHLNDTDKSIATELKRRRQRGDEVEPIRCPKCGGVRKAGPKCPHCGHQHKRSVRMVVMSDGRLVQMTGDVVRKRRQRGPVDVWKSCLYAAAHKGLTVGQARGWFRQRTGGALPADVKPQPEPGSVDWDRRCGDVYPWLLKRRRKVTA